jgi:hypothetical protein
MKLTTNSLVSLALAISASAAPVLDASSVATTEANAIWERSLEKRDEVLCMNRGPKVGFSLGHVSQDLLMYMFVGQTCRHRLTNRRILRVRLDLLHILNQPLTMCS